MNPIVPRNSWLSSLLSRVAAFRAQPRRPWYVVGGVIRDALLERARAFPNVDLAIPSGTLTIAKSLARELGGTFICLDEAAGSARIVVGDDAQRVELDVSDFRGASIEEDLRRRDFTINAMAVPLDLWVRGEWTAHLIDPLGGRAANDTAPASRPCRTRGWTDATAR